MACVRAVSIIAQPGLMLALPGDSSVLFSPSSENGGSKASEERSSSRFRHYLEGRPVQIGAEVAINTDEVGGI